jgi:hypothetical protein
MTTHNTMNVNPTNEKPDSTEVAQRRGRKLGNTFDGFGDSRTDAYKDMTDVSRARVDEIEDRIGKLNKGTQTPAAKKEAAGLMKELAAIYRFEAETATTPQVAKLSYKIADYLDDYGTKLESNNGKNRYGIPHQNTIKEIGKDLVVFNEGGSSNMSQASLLAKQTIELGRDTTVGQEAVFRSFVKDNVGKFKTETLEKLGEAYLEEHTRNPQEEAKKAVAEASIKQLRDLSPSR